MAARSAHATANATAAETIPRAPAALFEPVFKFAALFEPVFKFTALFEPAFKFAARFEPAFKVFESGVQISDFGPRFAHLIWTTEPKGSSGRALSDGGEGRAARTRRPRRRTGSRAARTKTIRTTPLPPARRRP